MRITGQIPWNRCYCYSYLRFVSIMIIPTEHIKLVVNDLQWTANILYRPYGRIS